MKIIDALKKLYAAQGGTPADVAGMKKTADVIEAIADNGGGGGGLPPVTADDNGDVLTVVNGAWDKAPPSGGGGGGGMFIITYTREEDTQNGTMTITSTKPAQEIKAAFDSKVPIVVVEEITETYWEGVDTPEPIMLISDVYNPMGYNYFAEPTESYGDPVDAGYYFLLLSFSNGFDISPQRFLFYAATLDDFPTITISTQ